MVRQTYLGRIESGTVTDTARLDLGDAHLWLYPQEDGTVRVEIEEKSLAEMLAGQGPDCGTCVGTGHVCENHPDRPWAGMTGEPECCGGAGMPCPRCCVAIPEYQGASIDAAFTPVANDHRGA